jgi:Domain of unknown function (DUF4296)
MIRLLTVLLGSIVFFMACSKSNTPKGILKPEKMQLVFWDMLRADVLTDNFIGKDSAKNKTLESIKLQKQILAINKVSREEYYNSLAYYKQHPAQFYTMLDTLYNRATRDKYKVTKSDAGADTIPKIKSFKGQ